MSLQCFEYRCVEIEFCGKKRMDFIKNCLQKAGGSMKSNIYNTKNKQQKLSKILFDKA